VEKVYKKIEKVYKKCELTTAESPEWETISRSFRMNITVAVEPESSSSVSNC
jgi:hypothetical protein